MSIQATSMGGANASWGAQSAQRMHRKPPDMSKDDLVAMQEKMKADGKDTSNLDKIIANFDGLDSDKSGKVSMDEVKSGAEKYGIELPKGPPRGEGPPPGGWGPPPGLLQGSDDSSTTATDETSDSASAELKKLNTLLEQLLKQFSKTDSTSTSQEQSSSTSVNVAA